MYNKRVMKQGNCSVCDQVLMIDEIGNGEVCGHCGWEQDSFSIKFPDTPSPILISLNKARRLYKQGKPLKVGFNDFIEAYKDYGEMEFYYNQIRYGMIRLEKEEVEFFDCDTEKFYIIFQSIEDFIANAKIDGHFVKDIWDKVEKPYWLQ